MKTTIYCINHNSIVYKRWRESRIAKCKKILDTCSWIFYAAMAQRTRGGSSAPAQRTRGGWRGEGDHHLYKGRGEGDHHLIVHSFLLGTKGRFPKGCRGVIVAYCTFSSCKYAHNTSLCVLTPIYIAMDCYDILL